MLLTFFITRIARQCVLSGRVTTSDGFTTAVGHLVKTCEHKKVAPLLLLFICLLVWENVVAKKRKVLVALSTGAGTSSGSHDISVVVSIPNVSNLASRHILKIYLDMQIFSFLSLSIL